MRKGNRPGKLQHARHNSMLCRMTSLVSKVGESDVCGSLCSAGTFLHSADNPLNNPIQYSTARVVIDHEGPGG